MQLVVGLGNPGPRYAATRHNVGMRAVAALADRLRATFTDADPAYREARAEGPAGPVVLLHPRTYMNLSGDAVLAWYARAGGPVAPPIVVCDDLHLPLGSLRIRASGGDGGQNGLASVIAAVGSEEVPRLRLGVGPLDVPVPPEEWADYVLADFAAQDEAAVAQMLSLAVEALVCLLAQGPQAAASRHNRTVRSSVDLPDGD